MAQESPAVSVGSDHQQPFLPFLLVLDEADGVVPGVLDAGVLGARAFARIRGSPLAKAARMASVLSSR